MIPSAPKLIHLNGPAAIGKDSIAQMYINNHPLALCIRTDELITALGQWTTAQNYDPARHLAFNIALAMISTHLKAGYDIIVPHLLTDIDEAQALEKVAKSLDAPFIEILLFTDKSEAMDRVFKRGTRGEPGTPPLTPDDRAEFEELYDNVLLASDQRPNTIKITSIEGNPQDTYQKVIDAINT